MAVNTGLAQLRRLRYCVEWDVKPQLNQLIPKIFILDPILMGAHSVSNQSMVLTSPSQKLMNFGQVRILC